MSIHAFALRHVDDVHAHATHARFVQPLDLGMSDVVLHDGDTARVCPSSVIAASITRLSRAVDARLHEHGAFDAERSSMCRYAGSERVRRRVDAAIGIRPLRDRSADVRVGIACFRGITTRGLRGAGSGAAQSGAASEGACGGGLADTVDSSVG